MEKKKARRISRRDFIRVEKGLSDRWVLAGWGDFFLLDKDTDVCILYRQKTRYNIPTTILLKLHIESAEYCLVGDWRIDYQDLVKKGWHDCYWFYLSMKDFHGLESDWVVDQNVTL